MPSPVVFVFEAKVGDLTSEWPTMLRKRLDDSPVGLSDGRQCSGMRMVLRYFQDGFWKVADNAPEKEGFAGGFKWFLLIFTCF